VWFKYRYLPFWPCRVTAVDDAAADSNPRAKTDVTLNFFGDGSTEMYAAKRGKLVPSTKLRPFVTEEFELLRDVGVDKAGGSADAESFPAAFEQALAACGHTIANIMGEVAVLNMAAETAKRVRTAEQKEKKRKKGAKHELGPPSSGKNSSSSGGGGGGGSDGGGSSTPAPRAKKRRSGAPRTGGGAHGARASAGAAAFAIAGTERARGRAPTHKAAPAAATLHSFFRPLGSTNPEVPRSKSLTQQGGPADQAAK
jgi:hypothetical protein